MTNYLQVYREAVETLKREFNAQRETLRSQNEAYFDANGEMLKEVALYRDCNICGSARKRPFLNPNPYIFVECEDCGFRYMDPIINPETTSILTDDISSLRQTVIKDPKWEKRHQIMTQQVREILAIKQEGNFLDVGCGLGRHMHLVQPYFSQVDGIELDQVSLNYCREAGLNVYGEPLETLGLPANTYDVVLLNQVIEHLVDPKAVCAEVFRILRPGGILYIDTPNFSSLSISLFKEHCSVVEGSGHISLFCVKTVLALLHSLGFSELKARTYQTDLFPLDVLTYIFNSKNFVHRRNIHLPFYLLFYRIYHEVFDERLFRNLGRSIGSYMRLIVRKPD